MLFLCTTLLCFLSIGLVIAKPINITVDDQFGPSPPFGQNISYGEGWFDSGLVKCGTTCQSILGYQPAINGTWKRSTYQAKLPQEDPKSATFRFNGTSVYVNIIRTPQTAAGVKGNVELLFTLDGITSSFDDDSKSNIFLQTVFSKPILTSGEHTLIIQNGIKGGKHDECMVFLDSIVYTTDDATTQPPPDRSPPDSSNSPMSEESGASRVLDEKVAIAAGVCGALGGVLLLLLAFLLYRYLKRRRSQTSPSNMGSGLGSFPRRYAGPPSSPSWHPSMFIQPRSVRSKHPMSAHAPSIASSRRHILSRSSVASSWIDPSNGDAPTEYATTNASNSVKVGSMREYMDPYGRRDPLMAVQEWQQRQSRISDMEQGYPVSSVHQAVSYANSSVGSPTSQRPVEYTYIVTAPPGAPQPVLVVRNK